MQRVAVLQELINKFTYKTYLEIGVHKGLSFLAINCNRKIAVDPRFQIDLPFKIKWLLKNPSNLKNRYFETTSAQFFKENKAFLNELGSLDLVFVDGLHTFKGSLNDVLNSLKYLNNEGCIVMHDCFPPNKAAATPAKSYQEVMELKPEGWNGLWCGDVWKTIVYLKMKYTDLLDISVLDTDFGLGIIKFKNSRPLDLEIDRKLFDEINNLDYDYLVSDPKEIINLKDKEHIYQMEFEW